LNLVGDVKGKKIIDIGCGAGDLTAAIADAGATVYGIDTSHQFLERARASFPHIKFDHMDACNMAAIDSDSFDGAVMFMVTFSIKDRKSLADLFRETARIMKPGGFLYYATVHPVMIQDHESPLFKVRLPEDKGYLHSEMTTNIMALLSDGNWIE